jgi:hypothetical protein
MYARAIAKSTVKMRIDFGLRAAKGVKAGWKKKTR